MFPLFKDIDLGERLTRGSWIVVFYHHDCPKCEEAIPKYERLARKLKDAGQAIEVALIEVPPYGTFEPIANRNHWRGKLSDRKKWFVLTPSEIKLADGRVTACRPGGGF